jgi:hypothetical protein
MPNGSNSAHDARRQPPRPPTEYEIVPGTNTGEQQRNYSLVSNAYEPSWAMGHNTKRFGTHEEALGYVEHHGLTLKTPPSGLPPSDAGDVGWAGRKS